MATYILQMAANGPPRMSFAPGIFHGFLCVPLVIDNTKTFSKGISYRTGDIFD